MRLLAIFFGLFLASTMAFGGITDSSEHVPEGEPWTATMSVDLPPAAYSSLQDYLTTLIYSRPLPWPYYLEKASVANGTVTVQGRILRPGTFQLPLGLFFWRSRPYVLPSLTYTSDPIKVPLLSACDLLLPFPNAALSITSENKKLQSALFQQNQEIGSFILFWQERLRHVFAILALVLVCLPIAVPLFRWWGARKPAPLSIPAPTIGETLQKVLALHRGGQTPWPQLVLILNKAASTTSLTTFELEQRFASEGRDAFAKAAAAIEECAYRSDNEQYFNQAIHLVEEALRK